MIANYHTHTYRCGHGGPEPDEEYVKAAIAAGFRILGFSDHCPWPYKNGYDASKTRMSMGMLSEYLHSVRALKEKYKDRITIYTGLECEYYEEYLDALREMAGKTDYLIFGCHWILSEEYGQKSTGSIRTPGQLLECADHMVKAMESGLFRVVNHPCHMLCSYPEFDEACEKAAEKICRAAKRLDLPVEYNLYGMKKKEEGRFKGLGYPCPEFWEIAAGTGCRAVIGVDAHQPGMLLDTERQKRAEDFLKALSMEITEVLPGLSGEDAND